MCLNNINKFNLPKSDLWLGPAVGEGGRIILTSPSGIGGGSGRLASVVGRFVSGTRGGKPSSSLALISVHLPVSWLALAVAVVPISPSGVDDCDNSRNRFLSKIYKLENM